MATLIVGPEDVFDKRKKLSVKNLKQYHNMSNFDVLDLDEIDVVLYRESDKDVIVKGPFLEKK